MSANYLDLRQRFPKFTYENFSWHISGSSLHTVFTYSLASDFTFHHEVIFTFPAPLEKQSVDENLIFHLGLSEMFSYWKTACSPQVTISAGSLNSDQLNFWHKLFIRGMGEYFYKNSIDFTGPDFLTIITSETPDRPEVIRECHAVQTDRVLVPVGGGKDSIVTLELLKKHFSVTPFVVNMVPAIESVVQESQVSAPITVNRIFDPQLFGLNHQGYLNGHIPLSAFYGFASVLAADIQGIAAVAFSNESSSDEGNTIYLGQEINHQYSKSLEFEIDLSDYLKKIHIPVSYFSFLRPLSELQITSLFVNYPQYYPLFTSCNTNFKMNRINQEPGSLWCKRCPKCV